MISKAMMQRCPRVWGRRGTRPADRAGLRRYRESTTPTKGGDGDGLVGEGTPHSPELLAGGGLGWLDRDDAVGLWQAVRGEVRSAESRRRSDGEWTVVRSWTTRTDRCSIGPC
jgi:hypothetical protein